MVICPANGTEIVKRHADYILTNPSAQGAIREVCEIILRNTNMNKYLNLMLSAEIG
jgi:3-deoxy-D-manno-octulosonate 8-phosphate phosphatase KdsC-like HAD superfamily phosphatase